MRKTIKIAVFVFYQIVAVVLIFYALELALSKVGRPKAVVVPTYYSNMLGDYEPDMSVFNQIPSNYPYTFTTNSEGFRSLQNIAIRKPNRKTYRILCLGDSYTMGWGVDDAWTYPELLRKYLSQKYPDIHFEVINAGLLFSNILDQYDYYKEKGNQLEPDLIIIQFCYNDIDTDFIRDAVTRQAGRFELGRPYVKSAFNTVENFFKQTHLINFLSYIKSRAISGKSKDTKSILIGTNKAVIAKIPTDEINSKLLMPTSEEEKYTGSKNFAVLHEENIVQLKRFWDRYIDFLSFFHSQIQGKSDLVLIAMPHQLETDHLWNAQSCVFSEACRRLGVAYMDYTHWVREETDKDTFKFFLKADGHLTREGNDLVARKLAEHMDITRSDATFRLVFTPPSFQRSCGRSRTYTFHPKDCRLELPSRDGTSSEATAVEIVTENMCLGDDPGYFETANGRGSIDITLRFEQPYKNIDVLCFRRVRNDGGSGISFRTSDDGVAWDARWDYLATDNNKQWDGKEFAKIVELAGDGEKNALHLRLDFWGKAGLVFDPLSDGETYRTFQVKASF